MYVFFVFSQFAFTSHEWLPLLHSSISWKSKQCNEELQRWSWWPWWWWWLMVIIVMLNVAMKMITVMLWDNIVIEMISKKKMLSLRHIHVINLQIIVTLRNIGTAYFFTWVCLANLLPPMQMLEVTNLNESLHSSIHQ